MAGLVQWDPFTGLINLHGQIDDVFNGFFGASSPNIGNMTPTTDIYTRDDKELVIEVHAPDFNKDEIEIHVHDDVLEIMGEKRETQEDREKDRTYMMRESYASFFRSIPVPKNTDIDKAKAEVEDGLIRLQIPLKRVTAPKKLSIQAGSGTRGRGRPTTRGRKSTT